MGPGGGRKKAVTKNPRLCEDLERLVEPVTQGDPESPLRWTCKSLRKLAEELTQRWWHTIGEPRYPHAKRLLISADEGGSNGSRVRLWK